MTRLQCLPLLLLACTCTASAGQGYRFTFSNDSDTPILVDFDTVKPARNWYRYNFVDHVVVAPHSTSPALYTEAPWLAFYRHITFMIYPAGQPQKADTLIVLSLVGDSTYVCTTSNNHPTPGVDHGWVTKWMTPHKMMVIERCRIDIAGETQQPGERDFANVLAPRTLILGTYHVNVAYVPNGDGETRPYARYHFHVSLPEQDGFRRVGDFSLSSVTHAPPWLHARSAGRTRRAAPPEARTLGLASPVGIEPTSSP